MLRGQNIYFAAVDFKKLWVFTFSKRSSKFFIRINVRLSMDTPMDSTIFHKYIVDCCRKFK